MSLGSVCMWPEMQVGAVAADAEGEGLRRMHPASSAAPLAGCRHTSAAASRFPDFAFFVDAAGAAAAGIEPRATASKELGAEGQPYCDGS